MSSTLSQYSTRIVGLLLIVEAVSVYFLWTLNSVSQADQAVFAILVAIDLVSFAMISYVYRTYKSGDQMNRGLLIVACCAILVFVYVGLAY